MDEIEGDLIGSVETALNVSESSVSTDDDDHFFDDVKGKSDSNFFFTDPVGSHIAHSGVRDGYACKAVLYRPLLPGETETGARMWDVVLLMPAAAALVFLLLRLPAARQRLRSNNR